MGAAAAIRPGTLAGLSVDQWLTTQDEPCEPVVPAVAPPVAPRPVAYAAPAAVPAAPRPVVAAAAPATRRRRGPGVLTVALWAAGLALGLAIALPLTDVTASCPPAGEGLVDCQLRRSILPAVMTVLGVSIAFTLIVRFVAALPSRIARLRSGDLLAPAPAPTRLDDPLLIRASGGFVYRSARRGPTAAWRPRWEQVGAQTGARS